MGRVSVLQNETVLEKYGGDSLDNKHVFNTTKLYP